MFRAQVSAFIIEDGSVVAGRGSSSGIVLVGSRIGGLTFERLREFEGVLHLRAMVASSFGDDSTLWRNPATGERRPNVTLELVNFHYNAFVAQLGRTVDVDWRLRLAWLKAQSPEVLGARFNPQPFTQCAEVLRNLGEAHGSRMILFERERLRLQARNVGFWERLGGRAIGLLAGYGYKNHYALYWALGVWLVGALIFGVDERLGEMRPADPHVLVDAEYQATGRPPADYEPVNALLYSADIFLPIVELGQQQYWIPRNAGERRADARASMPELPRTLDPAVDWLFSGWLPKAYYYLEILMGWLLASIVIAGFSGLLGHAREE